MCGPFEFIASAQPVTLKDVLVPCSSNKLGTYFNIFLLMPIVVSLKKSFSWSVKSRLEIYRQFYFSTFVNDSLSKLLAVPV